jgi:archaellum biogenesis protein FlaJ (TadC family)
MNYVIINVSDLDSVDFGQILETSIDTLSYSVDGTKTFVKFEGDTPSFLIGEPQYTREEILNILSGPEWSSSDEI